MDRIPEFPGAQTHTLAFPKWIEIVHVIVHDIGASAHGLLGYIMTDAEWIALNGAEGGAFVPLEAPEPDPPNAAIPYKQWARRDAMYQAETELLRQLRQKVLGVLDQHALITAQGNDSSMLLVPLRTIFERLRAAFGTLSRTDIVANKEKLDIPYVSGNSIIEYIDSHKTAHAIAAANRLPFNTFDKVEALIKGVRSCGLFKDCIATFHTRYPAVDDQHFDILADAIRNYASNMDKDATSATLGYAQPDPPLVAAAASDITTVSPAQMAILVAAVSKELQKVKPKRQTYCWSHGPCGHNSNECDHPRKGHDNSAT